MANQATPAETSFTRGRVNHGIAAAAFLTALLLAAAAHSRTAEAPDRDSPQTVFQELFVAVQTGRIFPDGKTFVDAVPNEPPGRILAQYRRQQPHSREALKSFVYAHFSMPPEITPAPAAADKESIGCGIRSPAPRRRHRPIPRC
jgi:alpha,alpha-trehalase